MSTIKGVEKLVVNILADEPETRGSDDLLYLSVINKTCANRRNIPPSGLSVSYILTNRATLFIPPYETVRRARQHAQEVFEDLRPTKEQLKRRRRQQQLFREYYGGND